MLLGAAACSSTQAIKAPTSGSVLVPTLATYEFPITTESAEAQKWFNQGLVLLYGFNHGEAIRSFTRATELDPNAAMPWWGIAYANGMHINVPQMSEQQWKDSYEAAQRALAELDDETELEGALVRAVSARTAWPMPPEQRPYDEAFAREMEKVHAAYPNQPDVSVQFTESLMNLQPWDYWTPEKSPKGRGADILRVLESALATDPRHPQAAHLYIHATEAGPSPEKAEPYADMLLTRVPGAGHLVHMPSHTYARVGRYADAVKSNEMAVQSDDAFLALGNDPGVYYVYHAHNLHFLCFAAMMEGRYEPAMDAAERLEVAVPDPVLDHLAFLIEGIIPSTYHAMIRFGKWEDILKKAAPPENRPLMLAIHHYGRGIAFSALGRTEEARKELAIFNAQAEKVPQDWMVFSNRAHDVLPIAGYMLRGEIAYREGNLDEAWRELSAGISAEDQLAYDEPPGWMIPVRHAMGALLLEAGEAARAEKLYREDQFDHPNNGWSLLGLKQSLMAQGKSAEEVAEIEVWLANAWRGVSNPPTSSCLCAPGT